VWACRARPHPIDAFFGVEIDYAGGIGDDAFDARLPETEGTSP